MRPGDPFPSVRALSRELKVNPNTAHKAIAQLVQEGLIEVRVGVGTHASEFAASTAAGSSKATLKNLRSKPRSLVWISKTWCKP